MNNKRGRPARDTERNADRTERIPLGKIRMSLSADIPKGFVGRWINDSPGRLLQAEAGGYAYMIDPELQIGDKDASDSTSTDTRKSRVVDRITGQRAYLMIIKEELYNADQKEKQRQIDETEESLFRGIDEQGAPGYEGRYVPKGGMKIDNRTANQ
ncbi:hypothetical protein CMI37_22875 [Candidatus Pacearchaeota archaeon]|nr:hypothetical protein [Candidatus Pacearchaeota archaeon]|tara:strand:+ start:2833 stop:3300 length:468 start_codon:yes stop_codon:yes gene_type:complete